MKVRYVVSSRVWICSRLSTTLCGKTFCESYLFTYFTLVELFCHRRRVDRQSDVSPWSSCSRLSSGFPSPCTISVHHPPSDFVAFPSVVVLLAGPRVLCSGERWCHPFDVCPPPDLVLVCCLLCWLNVYSPPNLFVSDIVHSGLSCRFSETPLLCCCQHLHFFCWWVSSFHSGKVELGWIPPLWSVYWWSWWFLCAQVQVKVDKRPVQSLGQNKKDNSFWSHHNSKLTRVFCCCQNLMIARQYFR